MERVGDAGKHRSWVTKECKGPGRKLRRACHDAGNVLNRGSSNGDARGKQVEAVLQRWPASIGGWAAAAAVVVVAAARRVCGLRAFVVLVVSVALGGQEERQRPTQRKGRGGKRTGRQLGRASWRGSASWRRQSRSCWACPPSRGSSWRHRLRTRPRDTA
jgi:hypothetical protein